MEALSWPQQVELVLLIIIRLLSLCLSFSWLLEEIAGFKSYSGVNIWQQIR